MVAGSDGVEAELSGALQKAVELQVGVAGDAGVRGPSLAVSGDIGRDNLALELAREVEHVVVHAELLADPPGVLDVGHRAAAGIRRAAPQLHGRPYHLVALLEHESSGDRGVHTARHGHQHTHYAKAPAVGAGVPETWAGAPALGANKPRSWATAAGTACSARSTSAPVEACPSVRRSAPERLLGAIAHGHEDVAWLHGPAGARRTGRGADTGPVQQYEQGFALHTVDHHMAVPRRLFPSYRRLVGPSRAGEQTGQQPVPQGPDAAPGCLPLPRSGLERGGHADDPGYVVRARPSLSFLRTAVQERLQFHGPAQSQGAHPLRAAELVGTDAHQVRGRPQLGYVVPRRGLDGVCVQRCVRGAPAHYPSDLGQGLQGPYLVVDQLNGDHAHAVVQCGD